jgi:plastocyanin
VIHFLLICLIVLATGCSSGKTALPGPTAPTPPVTTAPAPPPVPAGPPTVSITPSGMQPLDITITAGQRVTFVNNDTRAHDLVGGIDPSHPDCPEIAQAGFLTPGQSRETGVFTTARTCEYHDHTQLSVAAFQGRIIIR